MVLASGLEADMMLGTMGPGHGIATVEKVAIAAVMAGCLPDYMPVVIAAVKAVIDPEFDLTEMQATTHCTAPLIIVNGPARHTCGPIASGTGALGPGHRANATSAEHSLTMINIGKARPGSSDMALLGHPGSSPSVWPKMKRTVPSPAPCEPWFRCGRQCVTVLGSEAPHSVIYAGDGDDPNSYKSLLELLAMGLANPPSNNGTLTGGCATVVLNPNTVPFCMGLDSRERTSLRSCTSAALSRRASLNACSASSQARSSRSHGIQGTEQILILQAGGSGVFDGHASWCVGAMPTQPLASRSKPICSAKSPGWQLPQIRAHRQS